jgi:hypothetical protein
VLTVIVLVCILQIVDDSQTKDLKMTKKILELKAGGFYAMEDGTVEGPAHFLRMNATYPFLVGGLPYTQSGRCADGPRFALVKEAANAAQFTGEGAGDDFSCAEFPRKVPRINDENMGGHIYRPTPGPWAEPTTKAVTRDIERRSLTVSVWCGELGLLVADVAVSQDVRVIAAYFENELGTIAVSESALDRLAVRRQAGFVSLRSSIEARAVEEAFS